MSAMTETQARTVAESQQNGAVLIIKEEVAAFGKVTDKTPKTGLSLDGNQQVAEVLAKRTPEMERSEWRPIMAEAKALYVELFVAEAMA